MTSRHHFQAQEHQDKRFMLMRLNFKMVSPRNRNVVLFYPWSLLVYFILDSFIFLHYNRIHHVALFLDSTWSSLLFLFVRECLTSVYAYRLLIPVICCHVAQAVCDFRCRETQTAPVSGIARLFQQLQNVFDWLWKVWDIWSWTGIDCRQILQKKQTIKLANFQYLFIVYPHVIWIVNLLD